ncbi:MAG: hypothetical protein ACR2PZ_05505 [Pseudomonadales bacterium]
MLRHAASFYLFAASLFAVLTVSSSVAQPPDRLSNYRFLPRHSILHVQGGFAGFDIEANIFGKFGLVEGFRYGSDEPSISPVPSLEPYAKFVDVKARAINPTDFGPYSFNLDDTLNLTGLKGKPLPVLAPFDVIQFRGEEGQGAPMNLTVVKFGRWLFMKGANEAPCCDFFDYEIRAIARRAPFANFTPDDRIDDRDLTAWRDAFSRDAGGDSDGDEDSDGSDFLALQQQMGDEETMPSFDDFEAMAAFAAQQASVAAVPEPTTFMLLIAASLFATLRSKRN